MRRTLFGAVAVAAIAILSGCSSPPDIVEVEGLVTLNNQPLPHAEVQFIPKLQKLGGEYIATAVTDDQGRFKLSCLGKSGACECESFVVISEGPIPDEARGMSGKAQEAASRFMAGLKNRPIPHEYTTAGRTPLRITVTRDRKEYNIELTR